ncbi:hypothetical protein [Trueperella sp. LYQ143]|uniref:hypothetical protein n=1 Tax=Trueperella sp. LYQ143 TaxID=3391059 RepID=UPI003983135A
MKRIGGIVLVIVGLIIAITGVVRAAMDSDSTTVSVSVPADKHQFVYTAPGVLSLVDSQVTIRLQADSGQIQWGLGSTPNVQAFVLDASAYEVTGLSSWSQVRGTQIPGTDSGREAVSAAAANDTFSLANSDMWTKHGTGDRDVTVTLEPNQGVAQSFIATTTAGSAPQMELTWQRKLTEKTSPFPFVIVGVLLALIGALTVLSDWQQRAVQKRREENAARKEAAAERQFEETSVIPKINDSSSAGDTSPTEETSPTGEEIPASEATDELRDVVKEMTGSGYGAVLMPARIGEYRDRELAEADRIILPVTHDDSAPEDLEHDASLREDNADSGHGNTDLQGSAEAMVPLPEESHVEPEELSADREESPADELRNANIADIIAHSDDEVAVTGVEGEAHNGEALESSLVGDADEGGAEGVTPLLQNESSSSDTHDESAHPLAHTTDSDQEAYSDSVDSTPARADHSEESDNADQPEAGARSWRALWDFSWGNSRTAGEENKDA